MLSHVHYRYRLGRLRQYHSSRLGIACRDRGQTFLPDTSSDTFLTVSHTCLMGVSAHDCLFF